MENTNAERGVHVRYRGPLCMSVAVALKNKTKRATRKSANSYPLLKAPVTGPEWRAHLKAHDLSIRCMLGDKRLWVGDPSSRRIERLSTCSCRVSLP